jgi:TatD DNase family protein
MQMLLADSCFNINHESFKNDLGDILDAANNVGVGYFFCPASKEKEIVDLINLSESYQKNIFCSVGIHPHYASDLKPSTIQNLQKYLGNEHVRAIGEIGLDYYRNFQSPEIQKKCFNAFLELASTHQYPLFLHHREAFDDFYPMIKNCIGEVPESIVHCFTGTKSELKKFLDLGLYIGITGWVCDPKRGADLREIIKYIPLDRLLIETDAPYLVPKNMVNKPRNNRNEPLFLEHIATNISELLNIDKALLAEETTKNFKKLFRIQN